MIFTTLTMSQIALSLAMRSERQSFFSLGMLGNWRLIGAAMLTALSQLAILYVPVLQRIFRTRPLSLAMLGLSFGAGAAAFFAFELEKLWRRSLTVAAR